MFLKSLTISKGDGTIIRHIKFRAGLNLIVDETPVVHGKETGNNVGKTTALKLVDFCLGAKAKGIYTDHEHRRNEYKLVKNFLVDNKVLIALVLKDDLLQEKSREVLIERNFLSRKNKIQRVDGKNKADKEFEEALTNFLFPGHYGNKPTFRQIISHNIRYTDLSLSNTLMSIDSHTRDDEYETLYLFLFGCEFKQGDSKQKLRTKIKLEEAFKKRLEAEQTKSGYETALVILQSEIKELEHRKASLNLNPNFESDLNRLNGVKYQINLISSEIGRFELRKDLILEAQREMQLSKSNIDVEQLQQIYQQATSLVSEVQKTFQELYDFHNRMVESKIRFITKDLPKIDAKLIEQRERLKEFLATEAELNALITQSDSFELLEQLIVELNAKYYTKGGYESTLQQLNNAESKLSELNEKLDAIDSELFSEPFEQKVKEQINKFNRHFSTVSNELYGEKYALRADPKAVNGHRLYVFTPFNLNFSSGKKQGEIACFDIAYTLFADEENIRCMHFLLNDKKELMHDNQLIKIANFVNAKGIQFVTSILKDKLPEELNKDKFIVLKLSQDDKLFRIERIAH